MFDEEKNQMRTMNIIRSKENEIYSMKINNDDKIIIAKDKVHTFALRISMLFSFSSKNELYTWRNIKISLNYR